MKVYRLCFAARVGAWMDARVVGPATRKDFVTQHAAEMAAERVKAKCAAVESYEVVEKEAAS